MLPENVTIRQLGPEDWALFKDMRLRALRCDPAVFSSSYAKEAAFTDGEWQGRLSNPDLGVFCVFHGGRPIGMTGIRARPEEDFSANLWGSWLEKDWRGKGLSGALYKARIEWAKRHPDVRRIVVSHRESNTASQRANQKHGFVWTHDVDHVWIDGAQEKDMFYVLHLDGGEV